MGLAPCDERNYRPMDYYRYTYAHAHAEMLKYIAMKKGEGIAENDAEYLWYYFQGSGKAVKGKAGNPKKITIDGKKYLFNDNQFTDIITRYDSKYLMFPFWFKLFGLNDK